MATPSAERLPSARTFREADVDGMVEQCRDPGAIAWTTIPVPPRGYDRSHATDFFGVIRAGWESGRRLSWTIEVDGADREPSYAGGIDLRVLENGEGEIGFLLHPRARGRSVMSTALRLVRDYAFDVVGLEVLRWRALVDNWPSRHVAEAAGFRFDGTVRQLLWHRDRWRDGWIATLARSDRCPEGRAR